MPNSSGEIMTYTPVTAQAVGTGLDRLTNRIVADPGLARQIAGAEIAAGANAANGLNRMLLDAIAATGVAKDNWISAADVTTLSNYIHGNATRLAQWTALHGSDTRTSETGFHLVQHDGGSEYLFGQNLINTVAEGLYDIGFGVSNGLLLNEKGRTTVSTATVADTLNYFLTDQSTTGTGLDRMVDMIRSEPDLAHCTSATDILQGVQAANAMDQIIVELIGKTGANADHWITTEEVAAMNGLIRADPAALQRWTVLHGDDEPTSETGYHLVQNDGANTDVMGRNLVDTVADGIYHMGFEICDGRFLNEDGDLNVGVDEVATWLNYFYNQATVIMGNDGANAIVGGIGGEQINAGGGDDTVAAGAGNDLIYGSWGDDTLAGGEGNDLLYGQGGDDNLSGGAGDDIFRVTGSYADDCTFEGYDKYDGGAGRDKIVAYGASVDIGLAAFGPANGIETIDATAVTGGVRLLGDWHDNVLDFSGVALLGQITIDSGGGNDTVVGSAGNDVIEAGSWGDQSISGGAGNDTIHGGGGDDILSGGAGNDVFRVTGCYAVDCTFEGYDKYDGGAGQDKIVAYGANVDIGITAMGVANGIETIDASAATGTVRLLGDWNSNVLDFSAVNLLGRITIDGGGGDDTIVGSAGNDVIEGGDWGNQTISGGAGNDTIHGGGGDDILSGGAGDDIFRLTGTDTDNGNFEGYDRYDGGAGQDKIVAYGANVDIGMTTFGPANGMDVIDLSAVTGHARILGDWTDNLLDFSRVTFVGNVVIDGGGGHDTIIGSAGNDIIEGGSWGDQSLSGGAGNDILHGGGGNDILSGGAGDDIFRVTGTSTSGFEGYDSYDGGTGRDSIVASGAAVDIGMTAFGPANGVDVVDLSAVSGQGRLLGDWNNNVLDFRNVTFLGKAIIDGGGGNDTLVGSAGNDTIRGDTGNDILNGLNGNDLLTGGSGQDIFAFSATSGHDVVTDFKVGTDKINLHDAGVTSMAGLHIAMVGADTVISFGGNDIVLQSVQMARLTASDFVF